MRSVITLLTALLEATIRLLATLNSHRLSDLRFLSLETVTSLTNLRSSLSLETIALLGAIALGGTVAATLRSPISLVVALLLLGHLLTSCLLHNLIGAEIGQVKSATHCGVGEELDNVETTGTLVERVVRCFKSISIAVGV